MADRDYDVHFIVNDRESETLSIAAKNIGEAVENAIKIYEDYVRFGYIKSFQYTGVNTKKEKREW